MAGRRQSALEAFRTIAPDNIETEVLDVTKDDATEKLHKLIEKLGGMDLFLLSSGIGHQNMELNPDIELQTVGTNVEGFTRMVTAAFQYFHFHSGGHLAVISSIAGTKGLGVAPAYSATKRYPLLMNSRKVATHIIRALNRKQRVVVVDWRYALIVFFWRMIPRWIWKRLSIKTK